VIKAVHHGANGKFSTAVYEVTAYVDITEDMIMQLYPRAYGYSVSYAHHTRTAHESRFNVLVANNRQTTPQDLRNRLKKLLNDPNEELFKVDVMMAVWDRGSAQRVGTSRTGTTHIHRPITETRGVVAK